MATPVLTEHEAPSQEASGKQKPQQTPEEKKLVKKINKLLSEAKAHREKYDKDWLTYYKFFRGQQWEQERPEYRHSEVINMIFSTIQSVVPILTDSRPRFEYLPQEPSDLELSEILNQVAESDWTRNNWLNQVTEILYDAHIYGTAFGYVGWDADKRDGLGEICFESEDPFYMYPDPIARDVNDRGYYFIKAEPMDLRVIKRKWEKGKHVTADVDDSQPDKTDLSKMTFKSPTSNLLAYEQESVQKLATRKEALVITCYMKDDEILEDKNIKKVKKQNENGEVEEKDEVSYTQKLKYPKGRKVVMANGIILHDKPYEFDDSKFPFARVRNYVLPREFWGESEVAQLKSPQVVFNKMVSFALDVLTLMGNPIWIVSTDSGVDTDNLYNRPGEIVEKEPGSEVRREQGVSLQPYVLSLIDRMKVWFEDISGVSDVSKGATPASISAGVAITQLQEAAQTRIRQKSRNLDAFLQDVGQMYLSRLFQFYTVPRIFRLTGNDNAQQFFKFSMENEEQEDGTTKRTAILKPYKVEKTDDPTGEHQILELPEKRFEVSANFDVRVQTGSLLPFSRAEKEGKLLNFYKSGIIDKQEVLKGVDYPNWEAVLTRMKEEEAAMMAQAQAQAPQ